MFRFPEPVNCCFCIDLKIGSAIIATFSLIASIGNIVTWVTGVRALQLTQLLYQLYNFNDCDDACHQLVNKIVVWVAIFTLILDGIHTIMSALLIHGIRKDQPRLFVPYLSWQLTRLILSFCMCIALAMIFRKNFILILSFLSFLVIFWALDLYFLIVINSYKMK